MVTLASFSSMLLIKGGVHETHSATLIKRFDGKVRVRAKFPEGRCGIWFRGHPGERFTICGTFNN